MTATLRLLFLAIVLAMCVASGASGQIQPAALTPSALRVGYLRCEYLVSPLAVDEPKPRLSWELAAMDVRSRGLAQAAYQILVADSPEALAKDHGTLWDSTRVADHKTSQVEYAGKPLATGQQAWWKVRVWEAKSPEQASGWSEVATWKVGLLNRASWGDARWIGDAAAPPKEGLDPLPAPALRKAFSVSGENGLRVTGATAYITAMGLYELRLNGKRVGGDGGNVLAPEWTDYTKRVQYQAYDVTWLVKKGENCAGVILGDGWYAGKVGLSGIVPKGPERAIYGRQPRVLVKIDLRMSDGTAQSIVSDGSWRSTIEGPIVASDLLDGETYDARREMPGWDATGFDDSKWTAAKEVEAPAAAVLTQPNEPVKVMRELAAVNMTEPSPGVYIFDMGQNMVGWCRAKLSGRTGTTVTIRHAEVLNADGTMYTANLRKASQTDRYTFGDKTEAVFEPRFTYHGFRYVEVTGLASKPAPDAITGRVVNSSSPEVGDFMCSDAMLNRLWQNILWTQRSNLIGVPTDCPQRDERCGWMGDILAFAPTACFNMDMAAFLTKWIPDTRNAQAADGRFPDFAPHPYGPDTRFSGVPAWGDAGVFVPWAAYQFYGDTRIIADQYDAAVRWIEYIHFKNPSPDLLWKNSRGNDYGDWLNADTLKLAGWPTKGAEVPKEVFATMFFFRSTQIVSEMARVLSKPDDTKKYADLAAAIKDAFIKAYVRSDGTMEGDTQAGYALALHFGLIPKELEAAATARMVERFKPYNGQISTGFHSTLPLMAQLSARGHNDAAYRLVLNRKMPSWGYEVDHGATTIWERWDGWVEGRGFQDPGMNSFSHYAIGAVGEWMYSTMLGIQADSPGFETVLFRPRPGPGLTWAKGSYRSIRGPITSAWQRVDTGIRFTVSLPPGVSGRVLLPTSDPSKATLDPATMLEQGVKADIAGVEDGSVVYRLGSGVYVFFVKP